MNNDKLDLGEAYARADALSSVGASVEKAVRYLNAEFDACFYAVKRTLWISYMDRGVEQRKAVGTFV